MSAFEEFMLKEYPYYKSAGNGNLEMWEHIWNAAIKHAEALKPSHNKPNLPCKNCNTNKLRGDLFCKHCGVRLNKF